MKLSLLQETLQKGISTVSHGLATRTQLPILTSILFQASNGSLTLSTTNLEISFSLKIGAKVEKEGSLAIPGRTLSELVNSLPKDTVHIDAEKDLLKISCGNVEATMVGMDPQDFPPIPHELENPLINIEKKQLTSIVSQVAISASTDESRPTLTGVLFLPSDNVWQVVSTDGFRLSLKKLPLEKPVSGKWLVPARTLHELLRSSQDTESETIAVSVEEKASQIIFSTGNCILASRLIEGEFPDFNKIIPTSFPNQITFDRESMYQAVRLSSIFARESANVVKLSFGGGEVQISAENAKVGKNQTTVPAQIKGEGHTMAFNFRYLLDFLSSTGSEEITLETKDPLSPGVFKPQSETDYLHLIMPVRLQS